MTETAAQMQTRPTGDSESRSPAGVLILGGAHGALAIARSLGRRNIPVAMVSDDFTLVRLSRFIGRHFPWQGPAAPNAADWLVDLAAKHDLRDWLLVPGGDAEVRLIAEHRAQLRSAFRVLSCDWNELQTVCDKHLLGERATKVGIATPRRYQVSSEAAAASLDLQFPVVLKPAVRETRNAFTQAKAWRADSREEFVARYRDAVTEVGSDQVVVQEMIVGGGEAQFSYVALWQDGRPLASMTAQRTRQYPIDFSYTSTFVEVVECPEVKAAAETLLASIGYEGLAEVEFKYDARDGAYKVLDVNPRTWTWIGLGEAAGVDFAWLMVCASAGRAIPACHIDPEQKWIYAVRDAVAAFRMVARGDLSLKAYIASLRRPFVWAAFASDDPLPGLLELPLTVFRVLTKRLPASLRKTSAPVKSAVRGAAL